MLYKMLNVHFRGYYNLKNGVHWADFIHQLDEATYQRICYDRDAQLRIVQMHYPDAISLENGFIGMQIEH